MHTQKINDSIYSQISFFKYGMLVFLLLLITLPAQSSTQYIGNNEQAVEVNRSGQPVISKDNKSAQTDRHHERSNTIEPFGHNLFTGTFSGDRESGLNPGYRVTEGDNITVRIWGAIELNEILKVDAQGNIFIPKVGPVSVAGIRNAELNSRVEKAVRTVFTRNVKVYTSLNGTQPIAIFVTGYVNSPGRYTGVASNSMLYYIDRAGGINADTGSYRKIRIVREGKTLASADLYSFLTDGKLPTPQFRDGDTLVVSPRSKSITVAGAVHNAYRYEILTPNIIGKDLIALVRPLSYVSHARVSGIRENKPYSIYVALPQLETLTLLDGDSLEFVEDLRRDTIIVKIEGSFLGQSQYAIPVDAMLGDLLHSIPVDPKLADTNSISLRRKSIAKRQKQTLEDSLRRLENVYLTASSATDEEAKIRTQEAEMISDFVKRARQIQPSGRLVIASNAQDLILEDGDVITIPQKSKTIMVSGEVLVPQALVYQEGKVFSDYVKQTGGYSDHADPDRIIILRRNGEVLNAEVTEVREGDEILVLPDVPVKNLQVAKEIVDVIYKIAVSAAVTLGL